MELNDLKAWCKKKGLRVYEATSRESFAGIAEEFTASRSKRVTGTRCETNDRPPSPYLRVNSVGPNRSVSCTWILRGQANGQWWTLESYGMSPEDAIANCDSVCERLIDAWECVARKFQETS